MFSLAQSPSSAHLLDQVLLLPDRKRACFMRKDAGKIHDAFSPPAGSDFSFLEEMLMLSTPAAAHVIALTDEDQLTCFEQVVTVSSPQRCHCGCGFPSSMEAERFRLHALRFLNIPTPAASNEQGRG